MTKPVIAGKAMEKCLAYGADRTVLLMRAAVRVAKLRSADTVSVKHVRIAKSQVEIVSSRRGQLVLFAIAGPLFGFGADRLFSNVKVGEALSGWDLIYAAIAFVSIMCIVWVSAEQTPSG